MHNYSAGVVGISEETQSAVEAVHQQSLWEQVKYSSEVAVHYFSKRFSNQMLKVESFVVLAQF